MIALALFAGVAAGCLVYALVYVQLMSLAAKLGKQSRIPMWPAWVAACGADALVVSLMLAIGVR